MSDEAFLGYIGSLQARWRALVNVLIAKGLVTEEEVIAAVEEEVGAQRARDEEQDEEDAALGLDEEDDLDGV